ncbi:MAG TPA: cupin domain-containing protein [Gaiellaceae bacterium]|nr:cupin domain-containing protein [Gaiellaceae bacterium]
MKVVNLMDAERGEELSVGPFHHFGWRLGPELDAERLGCGLYDVPPDGRIWPYHWHAGNEEWLVVVSGRPTLRTPAGERELAPGDVVNFPPGDEGAHAVANRSEEAVRVVIFSTLRPGYVVSPDSGKVMVPGHVFRISDAVDYWDGEL